MTHKPELRVDLHSHSNASDGLLSPAELVNYAAERELSVIALTDHDSTSGVIPAVNQGQIHGIEVVAGVELSSEIDGLPAHILGYFIDPESSSLQAEFLWMNESRRERIRRICQQLTDEGIPIDGEAVLNLAGDGTVGRPHVARLLVEAGFAANISDAFNRFLTRGRPGYVQSEKISPEGAIETINRAGGVAVLAHPWSTKSPVTAVERLAPAGLSGVEAYYGEYTPSVRDDLAQLAAKHGLIATGGSDFHGEGMKTTDLGGVFVPPEVVGELREAALSMQSRNPPADR